MDLNKPYEKSFFPDSILKGLKFYFELLDKVNIQFYLEDNFPIKRKDVQLAIDFLSDIPKEASINNLCSSHPQLTLSMETIEVYSTNSTKEFQYSEMRIISCLNQLLFTALNIMIFHVKNEIPKAINKLTTNEKIKYLIENKYYYTKTKIHFLRE